MTSGPLNSHPGDKALSFAIHPGAPAQHTPRGRQISPEIPPHIDLVVVGSVAGHRLTVTDPDRLRGIARILEELAEQLDRHLGAVDVAQQLGLVPLPFDPEPADG